MMFYYLNVKFQGQKVNVCEFIIYVENLLHDWATFCGLSARGGIVRSMCYKKTPNTPCIVTILIFKHHCIAMKHLKL